MLTIRTCKAYSKALGEYLRQADYYSEGMKVEGRCYGQLCQAVGLTAGAEISDEAFERVAGNHHATTDEKLTERMAAGRRAGYDAVFNAPKSVSIQAFVGDDDRLIVAHEKAVAEALQELESHACHQHGRGINKRYIASGGIAAAVFRHGESRALDPHLHSHAFIFNITRSNSKQDKLLALESSNIFERTKYLSEVYRNALAREVRALGYAVEQREHGFELSGVSQELLEKFSKRAAERDTAIAAREAELGRELSRDEIAVLVRENRNDKQYELTPSDVRERQLAQVSSSELEALRLLRSNRPVQVSAESIPLSTAIEQTAEHLFERQTVVPEYQFIAETLRQSYGTHALPEIKEAISNHPGFFRANGDISTLAALDLERTLVDRINAGIGCDDGGFGFVASDEMPDLSWKQQEAVTAVLASADRCIVLRGRAGTGKTQTLATIIGGVTRYKTGVACFAPSTQAVDVLRRDGVAQAVVGRTEAGNVLGRTETVQRLLVDEAMQQSLRRQLIVVDEYGLLSTRQLKQFVDIAEKQDARLLLVGDSAQHKSVEAGDGARIVEKESRVRIVTLSQVHRQAANPAYKAAAEDLAAGRLSSGLKRLDRMGAIAEIRSPVTLRQTMVEEWGRASQEKKLVRTKSGEVEVPKTALMVAPTWAEIDQLNLSARHSLRTNEKIGREDHPFVSLRSKDWTRAQHKDVRNYREGDVLIAHKATKHFAKGDEMHVLRRDKDRLVVQTGAREVSLSPRQSGLAWTACESRPMPVALGDKIRVRAVTHAQSPAGSVERVANGAVVTVQSVDRLGRIVLADGRTLVSRQVTYAYALTSHAAQGTTVDKVFLTGALSREGMYVSATRGREAIRIFVTDRERFLDTLTLRSESRTSALEFAQHCGIRSTVRTYIANASRYLEQVRVAVTDFLVRNPAAQLVAEPKIHQTPVKVEPKVHQSPASGDHGYEDDHRHRRRQWNSPGEGQGPRMRL